MKTSDKKPAITKLTPGQQQQLTMLKIDSNNLLDHLDRLEPEQKLWIIEQYGLPEDKGKATKLVDVIFGITTDPRRVIEVIENNSKLDKEELAYLFNKMMSQPLRGNNFQELTPEEKHSRIIGILLSDNVSVDSFQTFLTIGNALNIESIAYCLNYKPTDKMKEKVGLLINALMEKYPKLDLNMSLRNNYKDITISNIIIEYADKATITKLFTDQKLNPVILLNNAISRGNIELATNIIQKISLPLDITLQTLTTINQTLAQQSSPFTTMNFGFSAVDGQQLTILKEELIKKINFEEIQKLPPRAELDIKIKTQLNRIENNIFALGDTDLAIKFIQARGELTPIVIKNAITPQGINYPLLSAAFNNAKTFVADDKILAALGSKGALKPYLDKYLAEVEKTFPDFSKTQFSHGALGIITVEEYHKINQKLETLIKNGNTKDLKDFALGMPHATSALFYVNDLIKDNDKLYKQFAIEVLSDKSLPIEQVNGFVVNIHNHFQGQKGFIDVIVASGSDLNVNEENKRMLSQILEKSAPYVSAERQKLSAIKSSNLEQKASAIDSLIKSGHPDKALEIIPNHVISLVNQASEVNITESNRAKLIATYANSAIKHGKVEAIEKIPSLLINNSRAQNAEFIIEATKGHHLTEATKQAVDAVYNFSVRGDAPAVNLEAFDKMFTHGTKTFGKMMFNQGMTVDNSPLNPDQKKQAVDNLMKNLSREQMSNLVKSVEAYEEHSQQGWLSRLISNIIDAIFNKVENIESSTIKKGINELLTTGAGLDLQALKGAEKPQEQTSSKMGDNNRKKVEKFVDMVSSQSNTERNLGGGCMKHGQSISDLWVAQIGPNEEKTLRDLKIDSNNLKNHLDKLNIRQIQWLTERKGFPTDDSKTIILDYILQQQSIDIIMHALKVIGNHGNNETDLVKILNKLIDMPIVHDDNNHNLNTHDKHNDILGRLFDNNVSLASFKTFLTISKEINTSVMLSCLNYIPTGGMKEKVGLLLSVLEQDPQFDFYTNFTVNNKKISLTNIIMEYADEATLIRLIADKKLTSDALLYSTMANNDYVLTKNIIKKINLPLDTAMGCAIEIQKRIVAQQDTHSLYGWSLFPQGQEGTRQKQNITKANHLSLDQLNTLKTELIKKINLDEIRNLPETAKLKPQQKQFLEKIEDNIYALENIDLSAKFIEARKELTPIIINHALTPLGINFALLKLAFDNAKTYIADANSLQFLGSNKELKPYLDKYIAGIWEMFPSSSKMTFNHIRLGNITVEQYKEFNEAIKTGNIKWLIDFIIPHRIYSFNYVSTLIEDRDLYKKFAVEVLNNSQLPREEINDFVENIIETSKEPKDFLDIVIASGIGINNGLPNPNVTATNKIYTAKREKPESFVDIASKLISSQS